MEWVPAPEMNWSSRAVSNGLAVGAAERRTLIGRQPILTAIQPAKLLLTKSHFFGLTTLKGC